MLLNNDMACIEHAPTNPERLTLQYPFLTTSTATRSKLPESTEAVTALLPSNDDPLLQPKKRLPLNMVISAMAEREHNNFYKTEEREKILSKIKYLKENKDKSFQRPTFYRRCKKHRVDALSQSHDDLEQIHKKPNCASSTIHSAERIMKADEYDPLEDHAVYQTNHIAYSGSLDKKENMYYSTPYAKSRFQQLYGNGVRTDFHFLAYDAAKGKFDSRPNSDILHPFDNSDMNTSESNIYACSPQYKDTSELNTREHQPFLTSQDLLQYADVPEEMDSTNVYSKTNDGNTNSCYADSAFNSSAVEDTEPATCFRVRYTKKNITYSNKHVQNNINISESHYEFIFEPKVIIEETEDQLSLPDLLCQ